MTLNLEKKIKNFFSAGLIAGALFLNTPFTLYSAPPFTSEPSTIISSTDCSDHSQEAQDQFEFKKLKRKDEKTGSDKKKQSKAKEKKDVLQPVTIDVFDKEGKFYKQYSNITFEQSLGQKNEITIEIPQGGIIKLHEQNVIDGFVTDMMMYYQGTKLRPKASVIIDLEDTELLPGMVGSMSFQKEKGNLISDSMRVKYKIVQSQKKVIPPVQRGEERDKRPDLTQEMINKESQKIETPKPEQERQLRESLFSFKAAYVQGDTSSLLESDVETAEKTGKGWIVEALMAKPNYQVWVNNLSYIDDCRIPVFGGNLRHVTNQTDLGIEAKLLGFIAVGAEFLNYNLKWETDWPDTTRVWSPYMEKYRMNGLYGGIGIVFGDFDKSFFEALYYIGKGKVVESLVNPNNDYFGEYITNTESVTDKSWKVHGRLDAKPFLIKANYITGSYDNSAHTLNGKRTMYNGELLLDLNSLLKGGLKTNEKSGVAEINLGVFYHRIEGSEIGLKFFQNELYGPIVIMNLKW